MSPRLVLLNPGPVTLSERVRSALAGHDMCHREPEFASLTLEINQRLAQVYPAMSGGFEAVTITGSGTAAVEGMLHAFAPRERATLVLANGVYGERIATMLAAQGKPHRCVNGTWLEPLDLGHAGALLDRHPEVTHVAAVHHETTTGRLNDLAALGGLCRERGLRLLLDCVSSFGAEAIEVDAWNVAALAATANKCLHGAPGLSFVLARAELWDAQGEASSLYLNLHRYHRMQHGDGFSPFTLAVHVGLALREALAEHQEAGGWRQRRQSYLDRARAIAGTLRGAGLDTLLPEEAYSAVLWSWVLPDGWTYLRLHDALRAEGFVIYAGQGHLSGRVFRIAHMGDIDADLERLCRVLTAILATPVIETAAILAAGMGTRLATVGHDCPKGFLTLGERPIVEESVLRLLGAGIRRVLIVTGYRSEDYEALAARYPDVVRTVRNERFAESGSLYSLHRAAAELPAAFLLLESDLIYEPRALQVLLEGPGDACLLSGPTGAGDEVYVETDQGRLVTMSKDRHALGAEPAGEFVGISRISPPLLAAMLAHGEREFRSTLRVDYETGGLVAAARERPVHCLRVDGLLWAEIDDARHLARARSEVYPRLPPV